MTVSPLGHRCSVATGHIIQSTALFVCSSDLREHEATPYVDLLAAALSGPRYLCLALIWSSIAGTGTIAKAQGARCVSACVELSAHMFEPRRRCYERLSSRRTAAGADALPLMPGTHY